MTGAASSSANVRVGVVGIGALGRHHARLYGTCAQAELVGVYDVSRAAADEVAAEIGTRSFADLAELIAQTDALSVAVPTNLHHAVVTELLQQDRHILVEKPLAATVPEGRELVDLAKARNLVLQVGHVERYNPVITYLDQRIDRPRFIESHRLAPYPPPRAGLPPRGTEVSVVLDLMIHDIDIILHLVNAEVDRIDAVGIPVLSPTDDIANARLSFSDGCVANITASRVSMERMRKIRVFQSDAYLSLDYQEHKGEMVALAGGSIHREAVPIEPHNALQKELEAFVQCVSIATSTGTVPEPPASGRTAQRALEIADEISRAIAANNRKGA